MEKLQFSLPKEGPLARESRQAKQLKSIIRYMSKSDESLTIPEISEFVRISIPTGTKLVNELLGLGFVVEEGKKETENGRKPSVYNLDKEKFFVVGVEILSKWIHVSVDRIDLETVYESHNRAFELENSEECLTYIISFIKEAIADSPVTPDQIIGIGIALTGSVNGHTGESADYFNHLDLPLQAFLEKELGQTVFIDNDTRVIGIAEQVLGQAKGVENALIVKFSRKLGLSIILDRQVVFGAKGFAGNFGHMQFGTKQRLCSCGKKNCLTTEVSGDALYQDLQDALLAGETSLYFQLEKIDTYTYHDVLDAVLKGDALSIKLLMEQGDKLGQALGNIANLLNPDLIVLGGEMVMVSDFLIDGVKAGMKKTGLLNSLKNCEVKASGLSRFFSSRGAACMVLKNYELINY